MLNVPVFPLFLAVAAGIGTLLSWLSTLNELVSFRRYRNPKDIATFLAYGLVEHAPYRQWKAWITWLALVNCVRGESAWGEMVRVGFER